MLLVWFPRTIKTRCCDTRMKLRGGAVGFHPRSVAATLFYGFAILTLTCAIPLALTTQYYRESIEQTITTVLQFATWALYWMCNSVAPKVVTLSIPYGWEYVKDCPPDSFFDLWERDCPYRIAPYMLDLWTYTPFSTIEESGYEQTISPRLVLPLIVTTTAFYAVYIVVAVVCLSPFNKLSCFAEDYNMIWGDALLEAAHSPLEQYYTHPEHPGVTLVALPEYMHATQEWIRHPLPEGATALKTTQVPPGTEVMRNYQRVARNPVDAVRRGYHGRPSLLARTLIYIRSMMAVLPKMCVANEILVYKHMEQYLKANVIGLRTTDYLQLRADVGVFAFIPMACDAAVTKVLRKAEVRQFIATYRTVMSAE